MWVEGWRYARGKCLNTRLPPMVGARGYWPGGPSLRPAERRDIAELITTSIRETFCRQNNEI